MKLGDVLTGVGVFGIAGTGVLAGRAGARLSKKGINLLKIRSLDEFKEAMGELWLPLASGGITIADILVGKHIDKKTIAGLAAVSGLSAATYQKCMGKFKEFVGEEKFNEIRTAVSKEMSEKLEAVKTKDDPKQLSTEVKVINKGQKKAHRIEDERAIDIVHDDPKFFVIEINGREIKFESTVARVIWGIMNLERIYSSDAIASVGQMLDLQGLSDEVTETDNVMGWSYDSVVDFTDDGSGIDFEYYIWTDDDGNKVCTIACDGTPPVYQEDLDEIYNGI